MLQNITCEASKSALKESTISSEPNDSSSMRLNYNMFYDSINSLKKEYEYIIVVPFPSLILNFRLPLYILLLK